MIDVKGARKTYFYAKGDYFRLLPAGEYNITLEVEGYDFKYSLNILWIRFKSDRVDSLNLHFQ